MLITNQLEFLVCAPVGGSRNRIDCKGRPANEHVFIQTAALGSVPGSGSANRCGALILVREMCSGAKQKSTALAVLTEVLRRADMVAEQSALIPARHVPPPRAQRKG